MINNYLKFSEVIESLNIYELDWWETRQAEISKTYNNNPEKAFEDETTCVDFKVERSKKQVWFHAEGSGNPYKVAVIVQQFFRLWRTYDFFSMTWANWCSEPRIGEFSGGGIYVTADKIHECSAKEWIEQIRFDHEFRG